MIVEKDFWWRISGRSLVKEETISPDHVLSINQPHYGHLIVLIKMLVWLWSPLVFSTDNSFFFIRGKMSAK